MKERILFLDNIVNRPLNYLGRSNLSEFENLVNYQTDIDKYIGLLNSNAFEAFNKASVVFIHKSEFQKLISVDGFNAFTSFRKNNNVQLVLFSGGISNNYYDHQNKVLNINDQSLYKRETLFSFLQKCFDNSEPVHLAELLYGSKWKLIYLFRALQLFDLENKGQDLFDLTDVDRDSDAQTVLEEAVDIIGLESFEDVESEIKKQMLKL